MWVAWLMAMKMMMLRTMVFSVTMHMLCLLTTRQSAWQKRLLYKYSNGWKPWLTQVAVGWKQGLS